MRQPRAFKPTVALLATMCLSGSASSLHAQTLKATILGTITDSSEAVIPAVQVAVTETNTNVSRNSSTNDRGFYSFPNLDPGTYRVEVQHPGFRSMVRSGVDLTPNTTARVDLELSPGTVSEVVDVTSEAPLLQTDRADTGGQIESRQVQAMPLGFNRNYQSLIALLPGVGRAFRPNSEFYNSQDSVAARVNGQGRYMNNYQLEGVDNNFDNGALTGIVLSAEAIGTADVSTSSYDPEFGNAGGAVTNVTMRSGGNDFHGAVFWFHQDKSLRATQPFSTTKAPRVYNQFGGAVGGPIVRDRLFFFGNYQGSRDRLGLSNLATIPTAAFRSGDLSASPTIIYDPATGNPNGTGRTPFADKQIPAQRISPISRRILDMIPSPTSGGLVTNFQRSTSRAKDLDAADAKVDYVMGSNDRLAGRYNYQEALVDVPPLYGITSGGPSANGDMGKGPARVQSAGLTYSRIFSPTLVSEIRLGFVRSNNRTVQPDVGLKTATELGIPGVNIDEYSSGMTGIDIVGYTFPVVGYGGAVPWRRTVTNWGVVANFTKTAGNHVVKWGTDIRRQRNDLQQPVSARGRWFFREGPAALNGNSSVGFGNSFASFLLDRPNLIQRGVAGLFPTRREWIHNFYFQDKWQVSQKLTLDLGMRWEYWPGGKPAFPGGYSNYDPSNNTLVLAGIGSNPPDMEVESKLNHGPRLGLAYRLNEKTVIRGGFGISFLPRVTAVWNFPVSQSNEYSAPNSFSAVSSLATGIPAPAAFVVPSNGIIDPAPNNIVYRITPKDWHRGYVQSWNIAVQRALPGSFALTVAYVGNHSINVPTIRETNYGQVLGGGPASQPLNQRFGRTASTADHTGTPGWYSGLQAKFDRKFSSGFMLTTSYTYSKSIDYFTDFTTSINPGKAGLPYNVFDLDSNRARSDFDVTHVYTQSFIYEFPFGPGKRWLNSGVGRWVLGNWQVNGIFSLQSGRPLAITASGTSLNTPLVNNRPNLLGSGTPEIYGEVGSGSLWFDTSRFGAPASATFGNVGRNILEGPGATRLDFSLFRTFSITEKLKGEVRLEAFNLANTPIYDNPNTTFGNAAFGQVTTSGGNDGLGRGEQRQLQVGLRLHF